MQAMYKHSIAKELESSLFFKYDYSVYLVQQADCEVQ
jgi:hypothetical protein